MKKYIPQLIIGMLVILSVVAFLVWQNTSAPKTGIPIAPPPGPATSPIPTPIPSEGLAPLPTVKDYNQPLKTFVDPKGIFSLEYPSSWEAKLSEIKNSGEIAYFVSPNTRKNLEAGLIDPGFAVDLNIGYVKSINDNEIIKGEQITVDNNIAYRVAFVGARPLSGIIIEHDGIYELSFQPGIDRKLQDAIIQHFHFIK